MEFTEGVRFDSLHLSPEIIRAIEKRNIEVSTPVQAGCIPPMMDWQDVIAKAPTGTGKTFAYGIPIVEHVDPEDESVQAVILAPTRELAIQITDEIRDLAAFKPGVRTVCLYGGAPIGRQIDTLKKHPLIMTLTDERLLSPAGTGSPGSAHDLRAQPRRPGQRINERGREPWNLRKASGSTACTCRRRSYAPLKNATLRCPPRSRQAASRL